MPGTLIDDDGGTVQKAHQGIQDLVSQIEALIARANEQLGAVIGTNEATEGEPKSPMILPRLERCVNELRVLGTRLENLL